MVEKINTEGTEKNHRGTQRKKIVYGLWLMAAPARTTFCRAGVWSIVNSHKPLMMMFEVVK
jgi:hypothetical protein